MVRKGEHQLRNFHKFSIWVWVIWLVPYLAPEREEDGVVKRALTVGLLVVVSIALLASAAWAAPGVAMLSLVFLVARPTEALAAAEFAPVDSAVCGASALISDTWRACAPMPVSRTGAAGAAVGDIIFVVGGGDFISATGIAEAYDTTTDAWASVSEMPTPRSGLAAATLDGLVYAIGGSTSSFISSTEVVEVYDPISDTWSTVQALPAPRGDLAAVAVGGKIYAIGGSSGIGSVTDTVTAYDPVSDTWQFRAPMPTPRSGLAAVVVDGLIYAIGGSEGFLTATATVEVYDPVADTWSVKADMPIARADLAAAVAGGKVYVVGGSDSGFFATSSLATNQEYDPVLDSWRTVMPMLTARSGLIAAGVGGRVYAIGGSAELTSGTPANEVYLPGIPFRIPIPLVLRAIGSRRCTLRTLICMRSAVSSCVSPTTNRQRRVSKSRRTRLVTGTSASGSNSSKERILD